jgi:diguanylate cyclase (GGDEF)-like protein/PAS domain S-box-containing protein
MSRDNLDHKFDQLIKSIPIGIYRFRTSPHGRMTFEYVNQWFCDMLGVSASEIYQDSRKAFSKIHPDEFDTFVQLNREVMKSKRPFKWEGKFIIDGKIRWFRIEFLPEAQDNGDLIWSGIQTDITDRKRVEEALRKANTLLENRVSEIEALQAQLRDQAIRDYLTGLFNRRYLDETMEREIARATREAHRISVVLIDIDHFKGINDTYGHPAGDMVLIELAKMLKENSRMSDIACRYGGDEFVVVMPNANSDQAYKRAEEWRNIFARKKFVSEDRKFKTTLSIGIATFSLHASSAIGVFQAADQALYQSKLHNNRVTISRRVATSTLRSISRSDT